MKLDIGHRHPDLTSWSQCTQCGNRFIGWRKERREKEERLNYKKKEFEAHYGFDARWIKFMKPELRKRFGQRYGLRNTAPGK